MAIIRKIKEGESYKGTLIGWKYHRFNNARVFKIGLFDGRFKMTFDWWWWKENKEEDDYIQF